ncbi:hypothetical protein [Pandoraea sp. NPDC087047]
MERDEAGAEGGEDPEDGEGDVGDVGGGVEPGGVFGGISVTGP